MKLNNPPAIIGHRGCKAQRENTLEAFAAAIDAGADYVECDVHITRDGVLVVHHDLSIKRIYNVSRTIHTSAYAELHDATDGDLATFSEFLDHTIGKTQLLIEIKSPSAATPLADLLEFRRDTREHMDTIIISSFQVSALKKVHAILPNVRLALLTTVFPRLKLLAARNIPLFAIGMQHRAASSRSIDAAHKRGLFVYAYTVDTIEKYKKLRSAHIDGIVTNYPEKFTIFSRGSARQ